MQESKVRFSSFYPVELSNTVAPLVGELWRGMGFAFPEDYPASFEAAQTRLKGLKRKQKHDGWELYIDPAARNGEIILSAFRIKGSNCHAQVNHEPDGTWYVSLDVQRQMFALCPQAAVAAGKLLAVALAYQLQAVPLRIG